MKKTNYEIVQIDEAEVTVDVSLLEKTEEIFFNATDMARPFGKRPTDFWKQTPNVEYLDALITLSGANQDNLVFTRRGKYGGTYFHHTILFRFAEWLKPGFSLVVGEYLKNHLSDERFYHIFCGEKKRKNVYVILCEGAVKIGISGDPFRRFKQIESASGRKIIDKFLSMPLEDAYLFEQRILRHFKDDRLIGEWVTTPFGEVVEYAFTIISNEADLINRILFGVPSQKFKETHGVDNVRDACTAAQLADLEKLQRINTGLIELGMGYHERKDRLTELCKTMEVE